MAAVRWIAVSDLHLGALNSVLTPVASDGMDVDSSTISPVMPALADCLRALRDDEDPAELVVLGDLFELALTSTDIAAATFGQFISALRIGAGDAAVCPRIRFLPGNHDHRLWTRARDAHYLELLQQRLETGGALPESSHATELLPERQRVPVRDRFVEVLAARANPGTPVTVEQSYPNLGMITHDGSKAVVLSHGHYVEPLYRLMSNLDIAFGLKSSDPMPHAAAIEADNAGWIDFFWSSMGDSGSVTTIVRNLYESLQSREAMEAEIEAMKRFVATRRPGPKGLVEAKVVGELLKREIADRFQRERHLPGVSLSPQAELGLADFVAGPVRVQLGQANPRETTFIFGHTHKPFTTQREIAGFAEPVSIVNTGGWVVDSVEPERNKGASIVVVDWEANVAVVRCYVQGDDPESYRVTVTSGNPGSENPLVAELAAAIDPARDPWLALGHTLAETVVAREKELALRLQATADALDREEPR